MMKFIPVSLFAISVAVGSSAYAADMGLPLKAPPPALPPLPTWTGFYVGGNLGAGFGDKWWNSNVACNSCDAAFLFGMPGQSLGTTSMDGFLGGFQAGFNWQAGQWVFGFEGTFDWTDMHGQFPLSTPDAAEDGGVTGHSSLDWIATMVGRAGITIDRALVYAGGGGAWTRENDSTNFGNALDASVFNASGSDTQSGWTFLAGVEYMIDPHWSARIQYNFYDFPSRNVDLTLAEAKENSEIGGDPISTQLRIHSVTAGANYRFWGF